MWWRHVQHGLLTLVLVIHYAAGQFLAKEHRTQAAAEKVDDLWCYTCDTMDVGERCVDLAGNHSSMIRKCRSDRRICMVKRFSYTTSTENSTSVPRMWSLERNCTQKCEAGCIIIGERTKLYACTSCCEGSLCNTGKGGAASTLCKQPLSAVVAFSAVVYSVFMTSLLVEQ